MPFTILRAFASLTVAWSPAAWAAEHAEYMVTELKGLPEGFTVASPLKINDSGTVIGNAYDTHGGRMAFIYKEGMLRDLGESRQITQVWDINNSGQLLCLFEGLPALLTPNGELINVHGDFENWFYPTAINDRGDMLGNTPNGAFVWNYTTGRTWAWEDPMTPVVNAINNHREMVGYTGHLGTFFDGHNYIHFEVPGSWDTVAFVVNNRGQVGGNALLPGPSIYRPFIYHKGQLTVLDPLAGDESASLTAINDHGEVTGFSQHDGRDRAFIYKKSKVYDLNNLIQPNSGWSLGRPNSINTKGQIVGIGRLNGADAGFLLTPIRSGR